jgi:hypothetical protein
LRRLLKKDDGGHKYPKLPRNSRSDGNLGKEKRLPDSQAGKIERPDKP